MVPPADFLVFPVVVGVLELNLIGETFLLGGGEVTVVLFGAGLLLQQKYIPVTRHGFRCY